MVVPDDASELMYSSLKMGKERVQFTILLHSLQLNVTELRPTKLNPPCFFCCCFISCTQYKLSSRFFLSPSHSCMCNDVNVKYIHVR